MTVAVALSTLLSLIMFCADEFFRPSFTLSLAVYTSLSADSSLCYKEVYGHCVQLKWCQNSNPFKYSITQSYHFSHTDYNFFNGN